VFLDAAAYERFATLADETFRQVSARTGVPLELLTAIREAIGSPEPSPDDRLREDETAVVPFLALQVEAGFRQNGIEQLLRAYGDSTRRIAEAEGTWWNAQVMEPAIAAGGDPDDVAAAEFAGRSTPLAEQAVLALYHAQQARTWTANLIEAFEMMMADAGIHSRLERPPAICFLDVTGYTRLTQERGDDAAADLATTLARLVQRGSVPYGGKPIKWLGDGVMFYFRDPGPGVRAALEMVGEMAGAGLPPAHVGLHAGSVRLLRAEFG
jgi:adenylate cyclase